MEELKERKKLQSEKKFRFRLRLKRLLLIWERESGCEVYRGV